MNSLTVRRSLEALAAANETVTYVMTPGNAGDCLISTGFFSLAREIGLRYRAVAPSALTPGPGTVVFGGGGGLGGGWSNSYRDLITERAGSGVEVVIMPQSIQGNEGFLESLGANVTLFVREKRSLEHVQKYAVGGCRIALDHDTAFHVDARRFLADRRPRPLPMPSTPKELVRRVLYGVAAARSLQGRPARAFRVDQEADKTAPIRRTLASDFSVISFFGNQTEEECDRTSYLFLRLLDRYSAVQTDRLHVAVGAALLGKKVELFDNSYFKCRAVFEMSMTEMDVEMHRFA